MASSGKLGVGSVELSKESKQLKWEVRAVVIIKLREATGVMNEGAWSASRGEE